MFIFHHTISKQVREYCLLILFVTRWKRGVQHDLRVQGGQYAKRRADASTPLYKTPRRRFQAQLYQAPTHNFNRGATAFLTEPQEIPWVSIGFHFHFWTNSSGCLLLYLSPLSMDPISQVSVPERTKIGGCLEIPRMVNGLWQLAGGHDRNVGISSASKVMDRL
jgi:hypothetical protein